MNVNYSLKNIKIKMKTNNVMTFVLVVGIVTALSFLFISPVVIVQFPFCSFRFSSVEKVKSVQGYSICFIPKALPSICVISI